MVDILTLDTDDIERFAETLTAAVTAVSNDGVEAGAVALEPIAGQIWMGKLTTTPNPGFESNGQHRRVRDENLRAQVFVRDGFRCTQCNGRAIPRSILVAIHDLFPTEIAYDAHYARGRIHPVFWALAPEADHVHPHARGGENTLENLTTLHSACNTRKSDSLIAHLQGETPAVPADSWDGLTLSYPALIAAGAGEARPKYHREWSRRYATFMLRH